MFSNAWIYNTIESICVALMVDAQGDPDTIRVYLDLEEIGQIPSVVRLTQQHECGEELRSYLQVEPLNAMPSNHRVTIILPGTMLRLGGTSGVTGPAPAAEGLGFAFQLLTK